MKYTPHVERLGFDENYLDLSEMVEQRISGGTAQPDVVGHVYSPTGRLPRLLLFVVVLGTFACPLKGGQGFLMSPPCLEFQCCQFDPTFLYLLLCSSA